MKIGLNTDSAGQLTLDETLDLAAELGLDYVEFATGAWSTAPHVDIDQLLDSERARRELLAKITDRGLAISALTCSGNPLHPGPSGREHDQVTRRTIALAPLLGVDRVVMMSGLPGGPGDANPNWITVSWPPETTQILEWQWTEAVLPYWRDLVAHARDRGVRKLCLEMHAHQAVYNVPTLLRLREEVGPVVGANFDPSHLMWMGADPLAAIEALGEAIYHVHAKDTRLESLRQALTSRLETLPVMAAKDRSWNYVTLGYGHDDAFWRAFCLALRRAGYDDVLSIEHEDVLMGPVEGVTKSVDLLRRVALRDPSSYKPQEI
ncbi:sugar phosphate isomerase/epimerase family protein [Streptomyces coeruleorubidus]|uniref:sugar phosphate isomerase/epimerase family protein n=1 Tax=Streptomyces coeruleorubidus TaxID=116188 RepID=UPI00339FD146